MQIRFKLNSKGNYVQKEIKLNSSLKAWVYEKLKNTKFNLGKNDNKLRLWTFSNLFPIYKEEIKKDYFYYFIFSSPNRKLIEALLSKIENGEILNLGEGQFEIEIDNFILEDIKDNITLESVAPIVLKTNRDKNSYLNYDVEPELFLKTLKNNLINKYNKFYEKDLKFDDINLFENIDIFPILRKSENSFLGINIAKYDSNLKDNNLFLCGNRLKFKVGEISNLQKEILQIGFDSGFGSSCSYGMGYVRLIEEKKDD